VFGLMSTAAHRRALENQSRVHREHVEELQACVKSLRQERDNLRTQLETRRQLEHWMEQR
jgi:phage shock protein A